KTQIVANATDSAKAHAAIKDVRSEWVLQVRGTVRPRPEGTRNAKLAPGDAEVAAEEIVVLNEAKTPPFYVNEETPVDENLRWKYRYVDLRRERSKDLMRLRSEITNFIRTFFVERGFWEIETTTMIRSDRSTGLRRALAVLPGKVLGAAAVAAAAQADPHGRWHRQIRADRTLLPRRGPAGGSHLRADAARRRDELRRTQGRHGHPRGLLHIRVREVRQEADRAEALAAHDVRRRDAPVRQRPAGHALRDGARRAERRIPRFGVRRVQGRDRAGRRCTRDRRAGKGRRVAERHRWVGRDREDARREGPRLVRVRRRGDQGTRHEVLHG